MCYNLYGDYMIKISKSAIKRQRRFKIIGVISLIVLSVLIYDILVINKEIKVKEHEKKELYEFLLSLEKEELLLKDEALKLEDDEYVARYAREKYLYSKEGELIIVLPED